MSAPRRWLDDAGDLSPGERQVLEAGLELRAPAGSKEAVKSALLAQLPAHTGGGGAPGSIEAGPAADAGAGLSTGAAVTFGTLLKSTAVGFALGVAATGSWVAVKSGDDIDRKAAPTSAPQRSEPVPQTSGSVGAFGPNGAVSIPSGTSSAAPDAAVEPTPEVIATPATSAGHVVLPGPAPSVQAFPERDSTLGAMKTESARLARARTLLRSEDARGALAVLESVERDHPHGVLVQEREVLGMEALLALGELHAAQTRARAFLQRYPGSPHAASARRVLERRSAP